MKTAVVILNWNGRQLLEEFLPSVVNYSKEATVYVADNASTDDSIAFLIQNYPEVKLIKNQENGGYAKGYNEALKQVEEELFILLNSDVEVTENWLVPLITHFKNHPETGIAQPKLLAYKAKTSFEYAGAAGGYIDALGYPFCRGRVFDTIEQDRGQYDDVCEILWASGACLAIRKQVFEQLGGLDELYFAHQEEIDLCWRAYNAGFKIMYLSESVVYHLGGATLNAMNPRKTFLNFRNSLFNLLKNVPGLKVYGIIFVRLILDGLAGIQFLCTGKPQHMWAIIRAHFSFYAHFKAIYAKRQAQSKVSKRYYKVQSVVWSYYALKRRIFNEIIK